MGLYKHGSFPVIINWCTIGWTWLDQPGPKQKRNPKSNCKMSSPLLDLNIRSKGCNCVGSFQHAKLHVLRGGHEVVEADSRLVRPITSRNQINPRICAKRWKEHRRVGQRHRLMPCICQFVCCLSLSRISGGKLRKKIIIPGLTPNRRKYQALSCYPPQDHR